MNWVHVSSEYSFWVTTIFLGMRHFPCYNWWSMVSYCEIFLTGLMFILLILHWFTDFFTQYNYHPENLVWPGYHRPSDTQVFSITRSMWSFLIILDRCFLNSLLPDDGLCWNASLLHGAVVWAVWCHGGNQHLVCQPAVQRWDLNNVYLYVCLPELNQFTC